MTIVAYPRSKPNGSLDLIFGFDVVLTNPSHINPFMCTLYSAPARAAHTAQLVYQCTIAIHLSNQKKVYTNIEFAYPLITLIQNLCVVFYYATSYTFLSARDAHTGSYCCTGMLLKEL